MRTLDWVVLAGWLIFILLYGLWRGRGSKNVDQYLRAGRSMPWWVIGLSIMATQASAITFISTTGQSYVDGMRFVQFYFGLPLAMVVLSATAVPIFHRANVYTAYEYLEKRFDSKTRALVSVVFLIQRGLAAGIALYAPAVVLSVIVGWDDRATTAVMGGLVIIYTVFGGIKAVQWADVQQMMLIFFGLALALGVALWLLPREVSFTDALTVAGAAGRLNPVTLTVDWNDRYNLFSGLIGGMFLALAYFGTDQSQVQRYLTGKSIGQSRLSLIFNAMAKIPMQFFILFIGAIVFVFYTFEPAPLLFDPVAMRRIEGAPGYASVEARYQAAFENRRAAARDLIAANRSGDEARLQASAGAYHEAQREFDAARGEGARLTGSGNYNDTNYIFLSFVMKYLPVGMVGLIIAVIFSAAMSTVSSEVNSLATVSVIDIYGRHVRRGATDQHYLLISKLMTLFWGAYAVIFARYAKGLGALIEAVNMIGSLFYGGMLGVFVLAFFFKRVGAAGAFYGLIAGEAAIFAAHWFTNISFLWYNVIGCIVVVLTGVMISSVGGGRGSASTQPGSLEAR
jgi:SSS family transporter